MGYSVYCLKEGSFQDCENLITFILSQQTKNIHEEVSQNCSSLQYLNYGNTINDTESSNTQYGIDLQHTHHF